MKALKFLIVGMLFGIVLVKSEAVSWYRIMKCSNFNRSICMASLDRSSDWCFVFFNF